MKPGGGLQPLSLPHGPVPHGAPVAGPVVLLAREDGEVAGGHPAPGLALTLQRVLEPLPVPEYLGTGRAPLAGAGQVDRPPLCGHRGPGGDERAAGLHQHGDRHLKGKQGGQLPSIYFSLARQYFANRAERN